MLLLCTCADDPCCEKGKGENFLFKHHLCPHWWSELLYCHLLIIVGKFKTVPDKKIDKLKESFSLQYALRYTTETIIIYFPFSFLFFCLHSWRLPNILFLSNCYCCNNIKYMFKKPRERANEKLLKIFLGFRDVKNPKDRVLFIQDNLSVSDGSLVSLFLHVAFLPFRYHRTPTVQHLSCIPLPPLLNRPKYQRQLQSMKGLYSGKSLWRH